MGTKNDNKGGADTTKDETKDTKPEEVVTLTKDEVKDIKEIIVKSAEKDDQIVELTGLIADLKKIVTENAKNGDPSTSTLEVEAVQTGKYARLRKYDGAWILGWTEKGIYRLKNNLNEIVEYLDVIVKGKDKPVKMELLSYLNDCPQEVVEIKEHKPLPDIVKEEGLISVQNFNEKTGEHTETGRKVRSRVISSEKELVFELDGDKTTIHQRYVNQ